MPADLCVYIFIYLILCFKFLILFLSLLLMLYTFTSMLSLFVNFENYLLSFLLLFPSFLFQACLMELPLVG